MGNVAPERRTADPSAPLPRISCRSRRHWRTSCAFPCDKGAHVALSRATWQEIRVRSGRDDKKERGLRGEGWGRTDKSVPG